MKRMLSAMLALVVAGSVCAQGDRLTRDEILAMTTDQLAELPLDKLMEAVETLGVSSVDELFALIMNKNVSSASKQEESSFTSPLASTVITREEMRTYGVTTIEEAFRLIPGMIVSEKTNGVYDVQMRGLSNIPDNNMILYTENSNILVMIDGRIVHNYSIGAPFFETLPVSVEDVERIEVVRGASSALYGPNAVNGVVNIVTEKPDMAQAVAQGAVQMGNNTAVADFGVRKAVNGVVALGLTANYQERRRKNSKVPFIPQQGCYVVNDASLFAGGTTLSEEQMSQALASGKLTDISAGADLTVEQIANMRTLASAADGQYTFAKAYADNVDVYARYREPDLARRTAGVNGYVALTPSERLRIDVQGGYQYALFASTPIGNEKMALRYRQSKTGYASVNASVGGLRLLANYSGGSMSFAVGSPAFLQDETRIFNVQAEYDIKAGPLGIRPGVSFQYVKFKDAEPTYFDRGDGSEPEELPGYWGYWSKGDVDAHLNDFAPSLRLDFKTGGLRLVGAVRADKTNIPDKWNFSWQVAASWLVNDDNFLRLGYGRSFRSAALANTSSNLREYMPTGTQPNSISFLGNEDAPLVHIDNVEIGYRWKPTNRVLIDAEAFYSRSSDYGCLKAHESNVVLPAAAFNSVMQGLSSGQVSAAGMGAALMGAMRTKTNIRYGEMPLVVNQFGIGLNVDWVISSKLIAKLNANIQRTTIDDYYQYSQSQMIARQLTSSLGKLSDPERGLGALVTELLTGAATAEASGGSAEEYIKGCVGYTPIGDIPAAFNAMSQDEQQAYLGRLLDAYNGGPAVEGVERPLGLYYALKYDVRYDRNTQEYHLATSTAEDYATRDGYRHKAAPSVYGMFGLIYKPAEKWNAAAFVNLLGKREYTTLFGTQKVDARCTVNLKLGYKPTDQCEVFFNAHNLFNTNKQEFIYTDKIGGIYTVGVSFGI